MVGCVEERVMEGQRQGLGSSFNIPWQQVTLPSRFSSGLGVSSILGFKAWMLYGRGVNRSHDGESPIDARQTQHRLE